MSTFEIELEALILEWLKRGDDPESMAKALEGHIDDLRSMIRAGLIGATGRALEQS